MTNFLVVAARSDIRAISFDVDYYVDIVIAKHLNNTIAVDVDSDEGLFL